MDHSKLLSLDVNGLTEKKGKFNYLSWAKAWQEFIKVYPTAKYEIKKNNEGIPVFGNDSQGYMCFTTVTIEDLTHEMWLPIMDFKNKAMLNPDMMAINKTVMRCLVKNLAMFGLGLYIYAGEDLPDEETDVDRERTSNISGAPKGTNFIKEIASLSENYLGTAIGSKVDDYVQKCLEKLSKKDINELSQDEAKKLFDSILKKLK